MRRLLSILCLLFLSIPATAGTPQPTLKIIPLTITTSTQTIDFTVELALTQEQQKTGLMWRTQLPEKSGMLFIFSMPHPVQMWMKNTLIPLDMVFIRKDNTISQVIENAVPQSETILSSTEDVAAVLELSGGTTARYHVAKGDRVGYSFTP